jgi:hypothetical protein
MNAPVFERFDGQPAGSRLPATLLAPCLSRMPGFQRVEQLANPQNPHEILLCEVGLRYNGKTSFPAQTERRAGEELARR